MFKFLSRRPWSAAAPAPAPTSSYLVVPKETADNNTSKLHRDLRLAFKYATSANATQTSQLPPTIQLEMPEQLKQGLNEWLSAGHGTGGGLEVSAVLFRPPNAPSKLEPSTDSAKGTLLSLPPEMRNRVYRAALIDNSEIVILPKGPLPDEPALLRTCSQIRNEATSIYYKENRFVFEIRDNDASLHIQWCRSSQERLHTGRNFFRLTESTNWTNLLHWLESYYSRRCCGVDVTDIGSPFETVAQLTSVVKKLRTSTDLEWSQVADILERMRKALGAQKKGWLDDGSA
ncbi:hypothetical protein LTR85_006802 [Meristemomyces frigidus]|nr:hypothetical protein LTR85_006802 [Meristemomyces frigidus]